MTDSRVMEVIAGAWNSWLTKLKWNRNAHDMSDYLKQAIDETGSLDEACRTIFTEGFAAGMKYGKASVFRECERRYKVN